MHNYSTFSPCFPALLEYNIQAHLRQNSNRRLLCSEYVWWIKAIFSVFTIISKTTKPKCFHYLIIPWKLVNECTKGTFLLSCVNVVLCNLKNLLLSGKRTGMKKLTYLVPRKQGIFWDRCMLFVMCKYTDKRQGGISSNM